MNNEKVYKSMSNGGATSIVLGIIIVTVSLASGILLIISGSRLLKQKSNILF